MNVLSLFDGISCGQLALQRANIDYNFYFASEIDKYAVAVTQHHFPNTIQLGDVTNWRNWHLPEIDLLIGGSPCQGFSNAGQGLNFSDPRSKLFFEFVDVLKYVKPKWFLLENVKMKKEWRNIISEYVEIEPIEINSALVSAQNRKRLYWTNISNITQPKDKCIFLKDIIENGEVDKDKSYCIDANYFKGGSLKMYSEKKRRQIVNLPSDPMHQSEKRLMVKTIPHGGHIPSIITVGNIYPSKGQNGNIYSVDGKSPTLRSGQGVVGNGIGSSNSLKISENKITWRKLTPIECERLQTIPDDYTKHGVFGEEIKLISNTQRYKMIGNAWTIDVIAHILKGMYDELYA